MKTKQKDLRGTYHIWVIRQPSKITNTNDGISTMNHYNTWEYLREGTPDKRCLHNVDRRRYSQIEVRSSNSGKAIISIISSE